MLRALKNANGMANTFLAAQGHDVGRSLCEHDLAETARAIMADAQAAGCEIILPSDVVVAEAFAAHAPNQIMGINDVPAQSMILDAGPDTVARITAVFEGAKTLIWNGPLGAFEIAPFDTDTIAAARAAARLTDGGCLVSVAGGGDTVAALNHAGVAENFTYVSTAGGAFLEWMEGKTLPGVAALQRGD
jgi:phosphoglycerate kinase